jgi:hypothetical protein
MRHLVVGEELDLLGELLLLGLIGLAPPTPCGSFSIGLAGGPAEPRLFP